MRASSGAQGSRLETWRRQPAQVAGKSSVAGHRNGLPPHMLDLARRIVHETTHPDRTISDGEGPANRRRPPIVEQAMEPLIDPTKNRLEQAARRRRARSGRRIPSWHARWRISRADWPPCSEPLPMAAALHFGV